MSLVPVRSANWQTVTLQDGVTTVGALAITLDSNSANYKQGIQNGQIVEVSNMVYEVVNALANVTQTTQLSGSNVTLDSNVYEKLGGLVKIPLSYQQYAVAAAGSASATFQPSGIWQNNDGSGTGLSISVPTGLNNGVKVNIPFYGRAFGVRVKNFMNTPSFDVLIDGVSYTANLAMTLYQNDGITTITDGECLYLIDDGLSDGLHYAELDFVAPSSGTTSIVLFGILVDSRAGYRPLQRMLQNDSPTALGTTATAIQTSGNVQYFKGVRKIIYTNSTAAAITVTVTESSTTIWSSSIPANGYDELDFGDVMAINSVYKHVASATGVNFTVIGSVI